MAGRNAQLFGALALALAGVAARAAQPTISSQPTLQAALNESYRYDSDGRATATGSGTIEWSLAVAAPGMFVDNLSGEVFWFADTPGSFPVDLVATNVEGSGHQTFSIQVGSPAAPAIDAVAVQQVNRGHTVSIQLSASGAKPIAWALTSGPTGALLNPATGALSWLPTTSGPQTFAFVATNLVGQATASWTVQVVDPALPAPKASFTASPSQGELPLLCTFDGTATVSNDATDPTVQYSWDFGDGSPTRTGFVPTLVHGYPLAGAYNVKLTAQNRFLETDTSTVTVKVTHLGGLPPQVRILASPSTGAAPLAVDFSCDCAEGSAAFIGKEWDYGDGEGSTRDSPSHVFSQSGGYNVKLRVTDANGMEGNDSFYVAVGLGNRLPPFARARATPVTGDTPLSVQFLAEFGDPDGVVVSRRWILPDGSQLTDSDPSTVLSLVGQTTTRLEVTDNDGLTSSDQVDIRVTRNGLLPPHIISTPALAGVVGDPYQYDEDGRPTARGGQPLQWEVGKVVDGQRVNAPDGITVDEATGRLTWTPRGGQDGPARVSLVVSNAAGADVQDFTVVVADRSVDSVRGVLACNFQSPGSGPALLLLAFGLPALARRWSRRSVSPRPGA